MNSKVIFSDGTEFSITKYPIAIEPSIFEKKTQFNGVFRDVLRLTIASDYATIAEKFVNNAKYSIAVTEIVTDEEGNESEVVNTYSKDEFCIAGDIVDHRDGCFTVYMGKKTEHELEVEALNSAVDDLLLEVLGV